MSTTTTTPTPAFIAAHNAAEADSLAVYKLSNLVKLAAFASESRRALEGIGNVLAYDKKAKAAISQSVRTWNTWTEMDDVTGEVLQDVAMQLEALSEIIANRPFELQEPGGADHE